VAWLAALGSLAVGEEKEQLHYLAPNAIDVAALLPAPPSPNSPEAKSELELLYWLQCHRTPEQVAAAQTDARVKMSLYRRVVGLWFTPENLPKTERLLFKHAEKDAKFFCEQAKTRFGRKRPEFEDSRIRVAVERETSPAYPSFHATRGILFATLLAEVLPEKRAALFERGREIGFSREVGGVHHPSDVYAGRVLGQAVARALLANPRFRAELTQVKAEIDAARAEASRSPAR
jgi:acid phosphatase (class A)